MKGSQIRLKLFLDQLGIPSETSNIDDRVKIQKAVYVGKSAGFDLGYPYGWYLKGPYSPELTRDYYNLSRAIALGDKEYKEYELLEELSQKLNNIKGLMNPLKYRVSQADWLELVASILFCKNEYRFDIKRTRQYLTREKGHLMNYFDDAVSELKLYKLVE